jgi:hypothetical protein
MGGKGGDSGSNQNEQRSSGLQATQEAQAKYAAQQQKAAETPVVEAPKEEEKKTETTTPPTAQAPAGENLTGLGDALVSGLSEGRVQQVADQTDRVAANPQTYAPQFDPYTGTFTGQGPYTGTTKTGQV